MSKATRTLSGAARDKYFRELFAAEPELPRAAAERLARTCAREIAQLRVREPLPDRSPAPRRPKAKAKAKTVVAPKREVPDSGPSISEAASTTAADAPAFDPYAFSLAALLKRSGRKALMARLQAIESAANLRRLAEAQHVAIPAEISDPDQLRHAIADGTAQRLADRRAAAS